MNESMVKSLPHLNNEMMQGLDAFKICGYSLALEGWRRGLKLKWYREGSELFKMDNRRSGILGKFFSLTSDEKTHFFFMSRGDKVVPEVVRICKDKEKTKEFLKQAEVPTPLGSMFKDDGEIINYANEIGFPVVIKPLRGSLGKGVYTNIKSTGELKQSLKKLRSLYTRKEVIIEKYYKGKEYRIYVVGDRVVAVTNRMPANITGDGIRNIRSLIELKNNERKKNPYLVKKLIKVDDEVLDMLATKDLNLESVPKEGQKVFLRKRNSLYLGGDPVEVTDEITNEVKKFAVNALKALPSIPHAGMDVIVDPADDRKAVILEVNATAQMGIHLFPVKGRVIDVPAEIIDYYFPETKNTPKTYAYYDYFSVLKPLETWSADEVMVSKPSFDRYYTKTYKVSGKVHKVGYLTYLRKKALSKGLMGNAKKIADDVQVTIYGRNKEIIEGFAHNIKEGSKKSIVENVEKSETQVMDGPFKLGFEIM